MYKVVILYAPQDALLKKIAECIQKAFDKKAFKAMVIPAGKAQIPDIAAADAAILGSGDANEPGAHPDFSEILRASAGANFAGRCAAFFTAKDASTAESMTKALADSEIAVFKESLQFQEKGVEAPKVKRWVTQFSGFIRKNVHE